MLSLRPITDANREEVFALRVSEAQEQFVGGIQGELGEGQTPGDRPHQRLRQQPVVRQREGGTGER